MRIKLWHVLLAAALGVSGWALAQSLSVFPYDKGLRVQDEGTPSSPTLQSQARGVNCLGGNVRCWTDAGWWFLEVDAGSGGSGAPANASYITEVAESGLSNEFAMGSLGTGLVKNTTTTGVPSIYAGSSCGAGTYVSSTNASGVHTCGTPAGVPGGIDRQVQFNNAGAFGGTSALLIDGGEVLMPIQTTHPAAPTGEYALPYEFHLGTTLPGAPSQLDSFFGKPLPIGWNAALGFYGPTAAWVLYSARARGYGSATVDVINANGIGSVSPQSCSSRNFATTSLNTRTPVVSCAESGAVSSAGPGLRLSTQASGIPVLTSDFIFHSRFWIVLTVHDALQSGRLAVGLTADTSAWYTSAGVKTDFSQAPNIAAFVVDYQQTSVHFCSNDASGAATCTDLGSNFPMQSGAGYDAWILHAAGSTSVSYAMERLDSVVAPASGTIAGDFPASGTQLVWRASMQEGADGGQVTIDWADTEILWSP